MLPAIVSQQIVLLIIIFCVTHSPAAILSCDLKDTITDDTWSDWVYTGLFKTVNTSQCPIGYVVRCNCTMEKRTPGSILQYIEAKYMCEWITLLHLQILICTMILMGLSSICWSIYTSHTITFLTEDVICGIPQCD